MSRAVVLFMTHHWQAAEGRRFARMLHELEGQHELRLLLHDDGGPVRAAWQAHLAALGAGDALHGFDLDALARVPGYPLLRPLEGLIPGCAHYPLLALARRHPQVQQWWLIEADVDYTGHWGEFFAGFAHDESDLLATHLRPYAQVPGWFWWPSLKVPARLISLQQLRVCASRIFLPVSRFSARALATVDAAHAQGWRGHSECLIPTALRHAGLSVADLLHAQTCYEGTEQDAMPQADARQSTVRWRPPISAQEIVSRGRRPLLFHPLKGEWCWEDLQRDDRGG